VIRIGPYGFAPKPLPTVVAVALLALLISLGNWQVRRAAEKSEIAQRFERMTATAALALPARDEVAAEDLVFRRVEVEGSFVPEHAIYLDNKVHRGVAGYHVVMPLKIGQGPMHVLVNRGWIAAGASRAQPPRVQTPSQPVRIEGVAVLPPRRILELSAQTVEGRVWENLVLDRYRAAHPIAIQPVVLEQRNDLGDGLVREWARPAAGAEAHLARAVTWYLLAVVAAIYYLAVSVRRVA
jgi:surfeit locus 1 family protein